MKRYLSGLVTGVVLCVVVPLFVLAMGWFNVAARAKPGLIERSLAPWAVDRSMSRRAPKTANPVAGAADALSTGLDHYHENCVMCHGAPGIEGSEVSKGLNPKAPHLDDTDLSDGELFWTIKNGVRMTGMPAFGPTHTDDEIWKIVAFVRHLSKLTPSERQALQPSPEEEEHHHGAPDQS